MGRIGVRKVLPLIAAILAVPVTCARGSGQSYGIIHLLFSKPVTVCGITVDSSGSPVRGVRIAYVAVQGPLALMEPFTETNADGRFRFETLGPAIVFRKDGFESQFVRVSSGQIELRIVLKPAPVADVIPICQAGSHCASIGMFCLPRIKGVGIGNKEWDIDASERSFTVRTKFRHWQMIHGAGPSWGGPGPPSRDVLVFD